MPDKREHEPQETTSPIEFPISGPNGIDLTLKISAQPDRHGRRHRPNRSNFNYFRHLHRITQPRPRRPRQTEPPTQSDAPADPKAHLIVNEALDQAPTVSSQPHPKKYVRSRRKSRCVIPTENHLLRLEIHVNHRKQTSADDSNRHYCVD